MTDADLSLLPITQHTLFVALTRPDREALEREARETATRDAATLAAAGLGEDPAPAQLDDVMNRAIREYAAQLRRQHRAADAAPLIAAVEAQAAAARELAAQDPFDDRDPQDRIDSGPLPRTTVLSVPISLEQRDHDTLSQLAIQHKSGITTEIGIIVRQALAEQRRAWREAEETARLGWTEIVTSITLDRLDFDTLNLLAAKGLAGTGGNIGRTIESVVREAMAGLRRAWPEAEALAQVQAQALAELTEPPATEPAPGESWIAVARAFDPDPERDHQALLELCSRLGCCKDSLDWLRERHYDSLDAYEYTEWSWVITLAHHLAQAQGNPPVRNPELARRVVRALAEFVPVTDPAHLDAVLLWCSGQPVDLVSARERADVDVQMLLSLALLFEQGASIDDTFTALQAAVEHLGDYVDDQAIENICACLPYDVLAQAARATLTALRNQ